LGLHADDQETGSSVKQSISVGVLVSRQLTGIAMLPAGLSFAYVAFFFKFCHPSQLTMGGRIATRIVALTPSMEKLQRLKIWRTLVQ